MMLAALITGAGVIQIREFPEPSPAAGCVVVDVGYCGICGTDVHAYVSGRVYRPAICGHEWTGTVSAIGTGVVAVQEGDRVVVGVPPACGLCSACVDGSGAHCAVCVSVLHGRDPDAPPHGGFAARIAVNASRVVSAHSNLDDETLAQVEPVAVALHAVNRSALRFGDVAVVLGAGPVGLTVMQCAFSAGARDVVVVEPNVFRQALASELGATSVCSIEAAADIVADHTRGIGANVVYDCVGGTESLTASVGLARRGGSVSMIGLKDDLISIDSATWLRKEITTVSAIGYVRHEVEAAMDLLADGVVRVDQLHTSTTNIEGLAATFAELASGASNQMKVLVKPTWSS